MSKTARVSEREREEEREEKTERRDGEIARGRGREIEGDGGEG